MLGKWRVGKVEDIQQESPSVRRFLIRIPEVERVDFQPGQFVTFDLPIHEKRLKRWRSYSIASAPNTNLLEFAIVRLPHGLGTTYLFEKLAVGDELKIRDPQGVFTLPRALGPERELCFICTGTGVAPFRSMLLHLKKQAGPQPKVNLIFGSRTEQDLLYRKQLTDLCTSVDNWDYHIALSREDKPGTYHGYVHPIYEQLYEDGRDTLFYLCGWTDMIDEARERLEALGYEKSQVIYEIYG